jgi:hypothetical protein
MIRKGNLASALFSAICAAGVLTLFSQVKLTPIAESATDSVHATSLNPGDTPSKDFGDLVPAALKEGAGLQAAREKKNPGHASTRLRLR